MASPSQNHAGARRESDGAFLAVDFGNTSLKATLLRGGGSETGVFSPEDTEGLLAWLEGHPADCGAMVSVRHTDARLVETLRQALDGAFLLVTHQTPLPLKVVYDTPATLGLDRVAAVCGAKALFPGKDCVVVDVGTAMTIDLLMAGERPEDDAFAGGSISPGLRMRVQALHDFTARLPLIEPPYCQCPGRWAGNTRDAMLAGALGGMADQVVCSMAGRGRGDTVTVVTGGDAPLLAETLYGRMDTSARGSLREVPDLIARGLQLIYLLQ